MSEKRLRRVLVANRGEIARRIIRTCHRLGIETVAVFTEPDRHALFAAEAARAIPLGRPESYLSVEAVISAARESGADAIHPGYGFLSENPLLADACEASGIVLIGPRSATMRALGSKTAAKGLAQGANVPTAPTLLFSADPLLPPAEQLTAFAHRVGYPVMIKAAAGGGGRGMRVVSESSDVAAELESAAREAQRSFGSPEVFAEKRIAPARHVEVQVAADRHGNVIALGTRDCTLQRSNQKMIEEAPASELRPGLEEELCSAACRLAKAAQYESLGTVEFLCSPEGGFFFLEVNTRLQVEHPVTEMITGLDLVELQIRIAEGARLPDLGLVAPPVGRGHAIEARLCAEEFTGSFALSTGIVQEFEVPTRDIEGATVRLDSGVAACSEVSHHYDSLLAKIIVHAETRHRALLALREVLSRSRISGVRTNRGVLIHLLSQPDFISLRHTIQGTADLLPAATDREALLVQAHALAAAHRCLSAHSAWAAGSPWMRASPIRHPWSTISGGTEVSSLTTRTPDGFQVECSCSGSPSSLMIAIDDLFPSHPESVQLRARVNGGPSITKAAIRRDGRITWVHLPAGSIALEQRHAAPGGGSSHGHSGRSITAHIPGKVAALPAPAGSHVAAGDVVAVLDSMKMEHPIKAPVAGTVKELPLAVGSVVQAGSLLVVIADD